jgi:hypothetical protein
VKEMFWIIIKVITSLVLGFYLGIRLLDNFKNKIKLIGSKLVKILICIVALSPLSILIMLAYITYIISLGGIKALYKTSREVIKEIM